MSNVIIQKILADSVTSKAPFGDYMGCEIQELHWNQEIMTPARLEKCKQVVPQLAHIVPWSELEKGAPTGQTQPHGLVIWQTEWGPYFRPTHPLGCTVVQGGTCTTVHSIRYWHPSPDLFPNHQITEAAPRCLAEYLGHREGRNCNLDHVVEKSWCGSDTYTATSQIPRAFQKRGVE